MKKKMYCLCVLMAAILLCAGCRTRNDKPDNTDNSVENTTESSEYETGAQLDPQTPLMELSDNLLEENYDTAGRLISALNRSPSTVRSNWPF